MDKTFLFVAAGLLVAASTPAWSYDAELAHSYAKLFAPVSGAGAGKALHLVGPDAFTDELKRGKKFTIIDLRTPGETGLIGLTLPDTMTIPVDKLFLKENLDRIPTDKPVMLVCKSDVRAIAAATALRHLGFENVYVLSGGLQGLSNYYGPKQAYTKPAPKK